MYNRMTILLSTCCLLSCALYNSWNISIEFLESNRVPINKHTSGAIITHCNRRINLILKNHIFPITTVVFYCLILRIFNSNFTLISTLFSRLMYFFFLISSSRVSFLPCCRVFETIRAYFYKHSENIPMAFVLGFYVTLVVKRWWEQYRLLPWPDTLALFVSAAIPGVVCIYHL